jgi:hypothetical protein
MNNIFTFGCSFTEDFIPFMEKEKIEVNTRTKYIFEFCDGIPPKSWNEILSEKIGFKLNNYGGINATINKEEPLNGGNCNYTIFNNFCEMCNKFQKDDIVIVEWTFMQRFKWVYTDINKIVSILPNWYPENVKKETMDDIVINRSHTLWIDELFIQMKLMDELAKIKKFKLYYWSIDKTIYDYKFDEIINNNKFLLSDLIKKNSGVMDLVFKNGGNTIFFETNNKINDYHFGKIGHEVLGNLFYNYLKKII